MNPLAIDIYAAYPLHKSPDRAERTILKVLKRLQKEEKLTLMEAHQYLLEKTEDYARRVRANNPKLEFVKHPSTWFNAGDYKEDPASWGPLPLESKIPEEGWARDYWREHIKPEFRLEFPEGKWGQEWKNLPTAIREELIQAQ